MTSQLIVDRNCPIDNLERERRSLLTIGTEVVEMQLVMKRLVELFEIKASIVDVEDHPEYMAAQSRLLAAELAAGRIIIDGAYEEQ